MTYQPVASILKSNPNGILYIKGDEDTDGSRRIIADPDTSEASLEDRGESIWNLGPLLLSGGSLRVDRNVSVEASGNFVSITDKALPNSPRRLITSSSINDFGSEPSRVPIFTFRAQFIIQPDDSVEVVTKLFPSFVVSFFDSITYSLNLRTGSVAATAPVTYSIRLGNPFGTLLFKKTFPASIFSANSDFLIPLTPPFDFPLGTLIYYQFASDEDFSLLSDPFGRLFFGVDVQNYRFAEVATFGLGPLSIDDGFPTPRNGTDNFLTSREKNIMVAKDGNIMWSNGPMPILPTLLSDPLPPTVPPVIVMNLPSPFPPVGP